MRQAISPLPEVTLKPKNSRAWRDSHFHRLLGLKAAARVERVLSIFEREVPNDDRPRKAMEAIRDWAQGKRKLGMTEVRSLSLDAHAAARLAKTDAARFAAHAAGQAVGTWHVPTHALGAFEYGGRAFISNKKPHKPKEAASCFSKEDLEEALRAITSMISKIEKAQTHFNKGTSQHTLAQNRLKALRIALQSIKKSSRKS